MRADVERSADLVHRWRSHLGEIEQRAAALESAADEQTAWLADHADDIAAAQALVRADETAIRHRVQAAEFQPPAYLLDVIGPRPDDPTERRAWRHAATENRALPHRARRHGPRPRPRRCPRRLHATHGLHVARRTLIDLAAARDQSKLPFDGRHRGAAIELI